MENFKEIADKCLKKELSGTFITSHGGRFHSDFLSMTDSKDFPYKLHGYTYYLNGHYSSLGPSSLDIIDFIPDNMNKFNFEDIAEKCLNGKLKGNFVLRNQSLVHSSKLFKNDFSTVFLYSIIIGDEARYITYNHQGHRFTNDDNELDIINFIPDMEERNVKLTLEKAKEWYKKGGELKEVALQAYKEEELKEVRPGNWAEYVEQMRGEIGYYIANDSNIKSFNYCNSAGAIFERNLLPTNELARAFRAYMQLISLHKAWVGEWKPDWKNDCQSKYCVAYEYDAIKIFSYGHTNRSLSFPTREMANEFITCFKDLLEEAKSLI